jgi:hypothetical protein
MRLSKDQPHIIRVKGKCGVTGGYVALVDVPFTYRNNKRSRRPKPNRAKGYARISPYV